MTHPKGKRFYAIKPMISGGQQGWFVQLNRQAKEYRRAFTVFRYGSTELALQAAIEWRDELVRTIKPMSRAEISSIERINNTSGFPGVYAMKSTKKYKNGETRVYHAWEARTPTGIKPAKKQSFSVLKYGDARAFELAVEARKKFVAQLHGYVISGIPDDVIEALNAQFENGCKRSTPMILPNGHLGCGRIEDPSQTSSQ